MKYLILVLALSGCAVVNGEDAATAFCVCGKFNKAVRYVKPAHLFTNLEVACGDFTISIPKDAVCAGNK